MATDVAARGLDINGIELVLQIEPPKEPETYIHRSGVHCHVCPALSQSAHLFRCVTTGMDAVPSLCPHTVQKLHALCGAFLKLP